jgi:cyclophilin family peptidyl-prolyl cis-trans isomerase
MSRAIIKMVMVIAFLSCGAMAGAQEKEAPMIKLETSVGSITLELYPDKAPTTVSNFVQYVDSGFYNGTIFHRVIRSFMIQGGGFDTNLSRKSTKAPIRNEAANGLKNDRGTIAMARTALPDSATSQFFINTVDNASLNFRDSTTRGIGYCVFGRVVEGMDVVDTIQSVKTGYRAGMADVPVEAVLIKNASRVLEKTDTDED